MQICLKNYWKQINFNGHALAEERTIAIKEFISDIDEQYRDEKLAELKECLVNKFSNVYVSVKQMLLLPVQL